MDVSRSLHTLRDRVEGKVDRGYHPKGCWIWSGAVDGDGYGQIYPGAGQGSPKKVHRLAWAWANMCPMPPGRLMIDHKCHNPPCVNPYHLRLVTRKQNTENLAQLSKNNRSGYNGVSWSKQKSKWLVRTVSNGTVHHGGFFDDVHEAGEAARLKRNELFTHNELDRL